MLKSKKSYFIPIIGFALIILIGSIILYLPISNKLPNTYETAFFTALSGTTTTGLTKVSLFDQYTFFGQLVISVMMEMGAMGFLIFISFFWTIMNKKIKISDMIAINDSLSSDNFGMFKEYSIYIFKIMMRIQAIGIVLYAIKFIPSYGFLKGLWFSIFHAISAFANSGYDLMGNNSFIKFQDDTYIQVITILIMFSGSVGILTLEDLSSNIKNRFKELKASTKILLFGTSIVIIVPTILLKIFEPNLSILKCLFMVVSSRSTGISIANVSEFSIKSLLMLIVTMFIGGAPTSTAGGVKIVSIVIIIATIIATLKGEDETVLFWRKIPQLTVRRAFTIFFLFLIILFVADTILYFNTDYDLIQIGFDTVSAISNTGLGLIDYAHSNIITDVTMMILMFIGRIGPLSMVLAFVRNVNDRKYFKYPEENIILW